MSLVQKPSNFPSMKSAQTSNQKTSNVPTPSNTSSDVSTPPWSEPELEVNVPMLLENLRETQHMLDALQQRKANFLVDLNRLDKSGQLDAYRDKEKQERINFEGVTFTQQRRKKKVWDAEVKKELQEIESRAKMMGLYSEVESEPYWVTRLETL